MEKHVSTEEADQLSRSTKKIKRGQSSKEGDNMAIDEGNTQALDNTEMESTDDPEAAVVENTQMDMPFRPSYSVMVQQNNPNMNFTARTNPCGKI